MKLLNHHDEEKLTKSMVDPRTTARSYSGILTRTKKKEMGAVRMTRV